MYQVGNKPYINLTYSYYSLIPASIPEPLALLNRFQEKIRRNASGSGAGARIGVFLTLNTFY